MPPSRLLALLHKLQGAPPQELDIVPSQPPNRRGLIGGGYRAYMAGLGDRAAMPAAKAFGAAGPSRQRNVQFATGGACTTCHGSEPPPPLPDISLPRSPPVPPLPPFGAGGTLLPPPLGGLAAAGWLAGILSGPQTSEYRRSGRPPPPSGASGDPYEWSGKAECTAQHNEDLAVCRSKDAPPGCYKTANERLANCNQGKLDFPPLWGWPPRS
jgi:hypothetical protein